MGSKNKYEKILSRKKIRLVDSPSQEPKVLSYQNAMELVRANRRAGNYGLGNYYLEQIARQITFVPEPSVYLLQAYLDHMLMEESKQLADYLRDKFPVNSSALRARARYHLVAGELSEAEEILLKAVQIFPNNCNNLEMLSAVYQAKGDRQRALEYYDKALHIKPDFFLALFGKARIVQESASEKFIEQIETAIKSGKFSGMQLASLHFGLAFIFKKNDIDRHFYHLNLANEAVAKRRSFNIEVHLKEVENIIHRFRRPVVEALTGKLDDDLKPIFIVSMPRSGTTLLEQIIGAHPQCHAIGESGAFPNAVTSVDKLVSSALNVNSPQAIEHCRQYLLRVAEAFKNNRLVAAAAGMSPVTKSIGNHRYIGLILLSLPNARVIHLERHPLAVIYSCYQQNFASENTFSFNLEWAAEYYKTYKALMAYWKSVFPEKILTVHYEKLVRDKQNEVARILKFCDLQWDPACLEHQESVGLITTSSNIQVRAPVYQSSAERWKKVEPYLEPAKRLLGEWLDYPA